MTSPTNKPLFSLCIRLNKNDSQLILFSNKTMATLSQLLEFQWICHKRWTFKILWKTTWYPHFKNKFYDFFNKVKCSRVVKNRLTFNLLQLLIKHLRCILHWRLLYQNIGLFNRKLKMIISTEWYHECWVIIWFQSCALIHRRCFNRIAILFLFFLWIFGFYLKISSTNHCFFWSVYLRRRSNLQ